MILILSEESDLATDIVCRWLKCHCCGFKRINAEKASEYELFVDLNNEKVNVLLKRQKHKIDLDEISKVWFRRGRLDFMPEKFYINLKPITINSVNKHFANEATTLENFIYYLLRGKSAINTPATYDYNKLSSWFICLKMSNYFF